MTRLPSALRMRETPLHAVGNNAPPDSSPTRHSRLRCAQLAQFPLRPMSPARRPRKAQMHCHIQIPHLGGDAIWRGPDAPKGAAFRKNTPENILDDTCGMLIGVRPERPAVEVTSNVRHGSSASSSSHWCRSDRYQCYWLQVPKDVPPRTLGLQDHPTNFPSDRPSFLPDAGS